MFKVLFKKQLLELKYMYFRQRKTGEPLNTKAIVSKAILYIVLFISLGMSFLAIGSVFIEPALAFNLDWLFFGFAASIAFTLSLVTNMFFASSNLYSAKDNEMLLAMPVKTSDIVLSRLATHYLNCLIYVAMAFVPMVIEYQFFKFSPVTIIMSVPAMLIIALLALAFANFIGYFISLASKYFKHRSYITVIFTIIFIAAYEFLAFNLEKLFEKVAGNIENIAQFFMSKLGYFYLIGAGITGNVVKFVIAAFIAFALVYAIYLFICKKFYKMAISSSKEKARVYNNKISKKGSAFNALLKREFLMFTSNATYLLNNGLGVVVMIGFGIASFFFKDGIIEAINEISMLMPGSEKLVAIVTIALAVMILGMDCSATPSVSLEGNNYWLVRSMPVSSWDVLNAKKYLEFIINVFPAVFMAICITFSLGVADELSVPMVMTCVIVSHFMSNVHLAIGILTARRDWTSEIYAIKQSIGVFIDIFGAMFLAMGIVGLYIALMDKISADYYIYGLLAVFALLSKAVEYWIKEKGTIRFEKL